MSWGKDSVYHCERIHGFSQAVRHFNSHGPVRSHRWQADERPLFSTRETRFKLRHCAAEDAYELFDGSHCAIRYEKPQRNGNYTVLLFAGGYKGNAFLAHMGFDVWNGVTRTDGVKVFVPVYTAKSCPAAKLVFNASGRLIVERSDHCQIGVKRSTKEDRDLRKAIMQKFDSVLDLLMLRMPTFHAEADVDQYRGSAFGGITGGWKRNSSAGIGALERLVEGLVRGEELTDKVLQVLLPYAQEVYNVRLSKEMDKLPGDDPLYQKYAAPTWGISQQKLEALARLEYPPLTEKQFRASLRSSIIRYSGQNEQSGWLHLPKFSTDPLPRNFWVVGDCKS